MTRLTLTFDNGPTPGVTERVLDILRERSILATFFLVGQDLARPGRLPLAQRARAEGHWHGNHTMTHSLQFGDSDDPAVIEREIDQAQAVLGDLARPEKFFRPWGNGQISQRILSRAAIDRLVVGGYTLALWNCVPQDWIDPTGWVDRALDAIGGQDWTVMVLHDQATGAMDQLERFCDLALVAGVEFRQDIPAACTPIRCGQAIGPLDTLYINHSPQEEERWR